MIVYVIRIFSIDDYGKISVALTLLSYFLLFIDFGFNFIGVREVAQNMDEADEILSDVLIIKTALACVSFIIMSAIAMMSDFPSQTRYVILLYNVTLLFAVFNIDWFFQAFEKMHLIAGIRVLRSLISLASVITITTINVNLIWIPISEALGLLAGAFLSVALLDRSSQKLTFRINVVRLKSLLKKSFPAFLIVFLATIYNNIDIFFINHYRDIKDVGIYSAMYKIINLGLIPIVLWYQTNMPGLSKKAFDRDILTKFVKSNLIIGFGCSVCIFIGADVIIKVLYGKKLASASGLLRWLSLIPLSGAFAGAFANLLTPWGMQISQLIVTASGAGINIALNFLLVPGFGMTGAAVATIAAELAVGCVGFLVLNYHWRTMERNVVRNNGNED